MPLTKLTAPYSHTHHNTLDSPAGNDDSFPSHDVF